MRVVRAEQHQAGWLGRVRLDFSAANNKTYISHRRHHGPLLIQKPFYPSKQECHVYLIHPAGGVVGGDQLEVISHLDENTQVLITTPGATKIYQHHQLHSKLHNRLTIAANAQLHWLPQETILFNEAKTSLTTELYVDADASFHYWEIICLGLPASKEKFQQGVLKQQLKIFKNSEALLIENFTITDDSLLNTPWGLQGASVFATYIAGFVPTFDIQVFCQQLSEEENQYFCFTLVRGLLIGRYLGHSAEQAKAVFTRLWIQLNQFMSDTTPSIPRIWNT